MSSNILMIEAEKKLIDFVRDLSIGSETEIKFLQISDFYMESKRYEVAFAFLEPKWLEKEDLDKLFSHIKNLKNCVLFYSKEKSNNMLEKIIMSMIKNCPNITGCFNIDNSFKNPFLLRNFISNLISQMDESIKLKSQVIRLNNEVNEITTFLNKELLKIKKVHEQVFPQSSSGFKGLNVLSKFEAGISSGGEFFDIIKNGSKVLIMMSSCDSYLKSTSILSLFSALKDKKVFDDNILINFIKEIESQFIQLSDVKSSLLNNSLLLLVLDTKRLEAAGYCFGPFQLIRSHPEMSIKGNKVNISYSSLKKASFYTKLIRGEKIFVISPGLINNWRKLKKEVSLDLFISDHLFIPGQEIINEVFYQVKKDTQDDFLDYDSSALLLEVSKNAISQV